MNELAIKARHAATALGRQIPRAEASTWPCVDVYPVVDPEAGAMVLYVTAGTMALHGAGYVIDSGNTVLVHYPSNKFTLGGSFRAALLAGMTAPAYVAHDAAVIANARTPVQSIAVTNSRHAALISAIRGIFSNANISISSHSDVEEGWTRPLIQVETGVTDPDNLSALEQKFYELVERHEPLRAALGSTTVLFE